MRQDRTTPIAKNKKPGAYAIIITVLIVLIVLTNLIAWNSKELSDLYRDNIFVIWGPLYGKVTGLTDRSVGEIMLGVALLLILLFIMALIILTVSRITSSFRKRRVSQISEGGGIPQAHARTVTDRVCVVYLKVFALILCIVALIQTFNCFVLYHTSTFEEKYVSEYLKDKGDRKYTIEELGALRDLVVMRANELGDKLPRDASGNLTYEKDMATEAVESMKELGMTYDGLSGYYGRPKALYTSEFFSQQYIMGYYFPFSMEANYNDVMYIANIPHTMCHELAHTKGFISEDEANLIGFLACIRSDDDFFEYSGYLSVLGYLDSDLKESIMVDTAARHGLKVSSKEEITQESLEAAGVDVSAYTEEIHAEYDTHVVISDKVRQDRVFLTKEAWDRVEQNAVIDTETVHAASDAFINTNLKANGVSQGDAIYSEVVALLMDFYVYNIEEELQ